MAEYIEREFNPCNVCNYNQCSNCILHELAMKFVGHPAADVVAVKYGRWTYYSSHDRYCYKCSICNDWATVEHNYCPNCGTKMDGE